MITDKEIQELVGNARKEIEKNYKEPQETNEDYVFYNLKAHLQAQEGLRDLFDQVNKKLVNEGKAVITFEQGRKNIKINNVTIDKHFDFSIENLFFTAIDFFSQIYEGNDFITTITFLNKNKTDAQVEIEY